MFKPELYQVSNSASKKDALETLNKYGGKLKWRAGSRIMDLGCGDGSLTMSVLRQFLPADYRQLVGSDVGERMVAHCRAAYADHRTSFAVWDMSADLPDTFHENFDFVFSSYAIHWVQEQEKVFENIFKMLSKGGECLLVFIGYTTIYDVYRVLARNDKWKKWLHNAEHYISPYQDIPQPEKHVRGYMAKMGFNNIHVTCEQKFYLYEEEHFKKLMEAISPFEIPADLHEEFMDDYMKAVRDIMVMTQVDGKTIVKMNYTMLVVNGIKDIFARNLQL